MLAPIGCGPLLLQRGVTPWHHSCTLCPPNLGWVRSRDGPQLTRQSLLPTHLLRPSQPPPHQGLMVPAGQVWDCPLPASRLPHNTGRRTGKQAGWDQSVFSTCQCTLLQCSPHLGRHCTRWAVCRSGVELPSPRLPSSPTTGVEGRSSRPAGTNLSSIPASAPSSSKAPTWEDIVRDGMLASFPLLPATSSCNFLTLYE
jgi:hypothetical protein